jgi:hypothetical protein
LANAAALSAASLKVDSIFSIDLVSFRPNVFFPAQGVGQMSEDKKKKLAMIVLRSGGLFDRAGSGS